jgi:hypothetical protein
MWRDLSTIWIERSNEEQMGRSPMAEAISKRKEAQNYELEKYARGTKSKGANVISGSQIAKCGLRRNNVGNKLGDMEFSHFPRQWGGWGNRSARSLQDRTRAQASARDGCQARQICRGQRLGRSQRIRAQHQKPDRVPVMINAGGVCVARVSTLIE